MARNDDENKKKRSTAKSASGRPAKPPKGSNKAAGTRKGRAASQTSRGASKGGTGSRAGAGRSGSTGRSSDDRYSDRKPAARSGGARSASSQRAGAPRRASDDRYSDRKPAARGDGPRRSSDDRYSDRKPPARSGGARSASSQRAGAPRRASDDRYGDRKPAARGDGPKRGSDDRYSDRKPAARSGGARSASSQRAGAPRRASDDRYSDRKPAARGEGPKRTAAWKGDNRKDERREARPKRDIPPGFGPYLRTEPERERRPDAVIAPRAAAPLRVKGVRGQGVSGKGARKAEGVQKPGRVGRARRLRKGAPPEVRDEIFKLGGRRAQRLFDAVAEAATAFAEGRDKDATRILRPVREELPNAASVRELYGLALYRSGKFPQAAKELEAFVELSGSVEQHPVLMDCARAQRNRELVQELWDELGSVSPTSALMMEGRIVLAGSMADSGDIRGAIELLEKKVSDWKRPQEHHARLWYALGDLYERAGELGTARTYFVKVRKYDASYADVAERLSGLR